MTYVTIFTGKVSPCFYLYYPSENVAIWGDPNYYYQKIVEDSPVITTKKVLSFNMEKMDFQLPSAPNLVIERETYMIGAGAPCLLY